MEVTGQNEGLFTLDSDFAIIGWILKYNLAF